MFTETCDKAYTVEGDIFGDPRFEDYLGDRDGKAAYVALDYSRFLTATGYYYGVNTSYFNFDCLVLNAIDLPGRAISVTMKPRRFLPERLSMS